jgi:[acyl-carrier-protein] S-malonyltransferase
MFPGVTGARGEAPEVARALEEAGPLSDAGRLQVETYALSVAGYRALGAEPAAIAEHSMGLYASYTCAGVWSFEDGARVTGAASRYLDEAPDGSIAICVGLPLDRVAALAADAGAAVANENSDLQQAVGGAPDALARFDAAARAAGAYDVVRIPLRGAVHTPALKDAAAKLNRFLDGIAMKSPVIPLLNHVDAEWWTCEEMLRMNVHRSLVQPVKWHSVATRLLREGYTVFVDVGPGEVMSKLMKWIDRGARTASVSADFPDAVRAITP